jgi:YaiO family outer membrane protein
MRKEFVMIKVISTLALASAIICILFVSSNAVKDQLISADPDQPSLRQTKIETGAFYYSFTEGDDRYGPWWGSRLKVVNRPPRYELGFTGIAEVVAEKHDDRGAESKGLYFVGSGIYDWHESIFTYSSIGFGSGEPFSSFNLHQEINFKAFDERRMVLGVGGGYVNYHGDNASKYFSIGSAYYWQNSFAANPNVILQYHFRRYFAQPVDAQMNTHILALEVHWQPGRKTLLRYIHGQELFRAGGNTLPYFDANQKGTALTLQYEEQLTDKLGIAGSIDFAHKYNSLDDQTLFSGPGYELRLSWNL